MMMRIKRIKILKKLKRNRMIKTMIQVMMREMVEK